MKLSNSQWIIHFSFWYRNEATLFAILLLLLSCCWFVVELLLNCCYYLEIIDFRGGCQGALGHDRRHLFRIWVEFVFSLFPCTLLLSKKNILHENDIKTDSKIHSKPDLGHGFSDCLHTLFLKDSLKFLLYFLGFSCSEKHKKHNENKALKTHIAKIHFSNTDIKQIRKMSSKRRPNRWGDSGRSRCGASCGTFGAPACLSTPKIQPKPSKNEPKFAKMIPKGTSKWQIILARRTAGSD